MRFRALFAAAAALAPAVLGSAAAAGVDRDARMSVPAPGVHPRVLFTAAEVPAIRERAGTPLGKQFLFAVAWQVDYPGRSLLEKCAKGEKADPDALCDFAHWAATAYLASGDAAYLDRAKAFLGYWAAAVRPLPEAPQAAWSRSLHRLALTYDYLYNDLPEDLRAVMRAYMAVRLDRPTQERELRRRAYGIGPSFSGRGCDWAAIWAGGLAMSCLALEGEHPRASKEMLDLAVSVMKWIADYSLTPEGATPNGNGYAGGDFVSYFNALRALQRRGTMLIDHPNIREMPDWLAHEIVPGMYLFDNRNQSSGYLGLSPTVVALAARFGGVAEWVQEQAFGPERRPAADPVGAAAALVYGVVPEVPPRMPELQLTRWSSSLGTVFSRSGWKAGDSLFVLTMEPPGQHHTHPDKGSFTFYSHGRMFAADSGGSYFEPRHHNTILIDGVGQAGGQGATDAVVRAHLSSGLADVTCVDVKPACDARLAYTESDGPADWSLLRPGKGLPLRWEPHMPVVRADRRAVYVRSAAGAYAVVLDDIQRDDGEHTYEWLLHSPLPGEISGNTATFRSRFGGPYVQSETGAKPVVFVAEVPEAGEYTVWVLAGTFPDLKSSHYYTGVKVNRQQARQLYLGHHCGDWQWQSVGKAAKPEDTRWTLPAGAVPVEIGVKRGGRIAQVLLARDAAYRPEFALKAPGPGLLLAAPAAAVEGPDWSLSAAPDPQPRMDALFLQPAQGLSLSIAGPGKGDNPALRRLVAAQKAVRAGYAAVLLPSDASGPPPVVTPGPVGSGQATITRGTETDYLYANPCGVRTALWHCASDGAFALARTAGNVLKGFVLVDGGTISYRGRELVQATGRVSVVHDGERCSILGEPGSVVRIAALGAQSVTVNRRPAAAARRGSMLEVAVPQLPKEWSVSFSPDGTIVSVEGDGPVPLAIEAPKAIKCLVNGVSVWFSRAPGGRIYPKIGVTVPSHGDDPPAD